MQLTQHAFLRDLARLFHLKLLIRIQPLFARHLQNGPLHERVQHALLDGDAATGGAGVGVEEQNGRLLGAAVRVCIPEEGEARLGWGDGLDEVGDGRWVGRGGDQLDGFGGGVYFLLCWKKGLLVTLMVMTGGRRREGKRVERKNIPASPTHYHYQKTTP